MDFSEIFQRLGLDWKILIINIVNFLVFYLILQRFVFSKIGKIVKDRQDRIEKSLKDAEKIEKELANAQQKADEILGEASKKANQIIVNAEAEANKRAEEIKTQANKDAEAIIEKGKKQIEVEKQEMITRLKTETANLTIQAAEKILDDKLDKEADAKLINKYLDKLEKDVKNNNH